MLPLAVVGILAIELELGDAAIIAMVVNGMSSLWNLATLVPSLSVSVRRFHDAGISAKWLAFLYAVFIAVPVLLIFSRPDKETFLTGIVVLFLFGIAAFVVTLLPSQPHDNH